LGSSIGGAELPSEFFFFTGVLIGRPKKSVATYKIIKKHASKSNKSIIILIISIIIITIEDNNNERIK